MPTVAIVDGVKIRFYPTEHPPPHFHAVFAEFTAHVAIDPAGILRGSLPPNKVGLVLSWASQRQSEPLMAWNAMAAGKKPGKIA